MSFLTNELRTNCGTGSISTCFWARIEGDSERPRNARQTEGFPCKLCLCLCLRFKDTSAQQALMSKRLLELSGKAKMCLRVTSYWCIWLLLIWLLFISLSIWSVFRCLVHILHSPLCHIVSMWISCYYSSPLLLKIQICIGYPQRRFRFDVYSFMYSVKLMKAWFMLS